jgi:DNA-binding MurR/RpiR family transcriptional regulator|tara:strand:+ start:2495 stop:3355 length:861 start_codon:yes stop_codon:yes gene_type:complete
MAELFTTISQARPAMRPAQKKVADFVLKHPEKAASSTISELSKAVGISTASVVRFCEDIEFSSFTAFRLAVSVASEQRRVARETFSIDKDEIDPNDSMQEVVAKTVFHEVEAIQQTGSNLDLKTLEKVVGLITKAKRIELFGLGSSSLATQDLRQKLHRIGLFAFDSPDNHQAITSSALMNPGDVGIVFSHSGVTPETLEVLKIMKRSGAKTVAVTNFPESVISRNADFRLTTVAKETRYRSGAMSSRIAQLALVDFLFVRIMQLRLESAELLLQRTYEAVRGDRL